ncbi:cysteine dioxygenase-like isoform X1 [Biomphalaria glabrata]|uniref:Cysteine dioxygenase n=1 Tax=Biomphalaria glabrata TaxID=6526 RepID=A0A9W2ZME7_BIOGL|nr:cysteine dioxygenase-like isoform X1 [Biomphalaria glabrata]
MASLQELIWELEENLRQNPNAEIGEILTRSQIDFNDWVRYAFVRESKGCNRNLIFDEPDLFRLTLSVWRPKTQNDMHDHGQSKCYFKVLRGILEENHYHGDGHIANMEYRQGEVCSIVDIGTCHQMLNNMDAFSVSLHVYIPPFDSCNTYAEPGGAAIPVTPSFISRYGFAVDRNSSLLRPDVFLA